MLLDSKTAVVDNDFINHVCESRIDDNRVISILTTMLSELDLTAAIHPLVYDKEVLKTNLRIMNLFHKNIIYKATFTDIFQRNTTKEAYYSYLVRELYRSISGEEFPPEPNMVMYYWKTQSNLGEVHSISMCLVCGCGIFLSDDSDSKKLQAYIKKKSLGSINVYNRSELIDKHMKEGSTTFPRTERKSLAHMAK